MKTILSISILFLFFIPKNYSQDTLRKPKIALVLSGGVAKGLAHIGVLKVLEEQGIRPDIIIGTSMGSIIGGLYSIGYSASDLERITLKTDWYKYLSNDTNLRDINIEEKDDFEEFVYNFPIKKKRPSLGKGVIYGHELELYLNEITFPANIYSNFDEYPIQFRAISTDILSGEVYVFKDGLLSTALRASMSLPTLFEPVNHDGKLLVDGGVLDNFGVDIAIENGADIIIGSNVSRIMDKVDEFDSYKNLFSHLMMIQSKRRYKKYKKFVNILIEPPVLDMGTRFDKSQEIIDIGYETASKHIAELLELKQKLNIVAKGKKQSSNIEKDSLFYPISKIAIRGIIDASFKFHIYSILRNNIGIKANHRMIENEIRKLYGSGQFAFIKYNIEKIASNDYKLVFSFRERSKNNLQLGVHYNNQSGLGIVIGFMSRNSVSPGTKFKLRGRISKYPGIDESFVKFFKGKKKFGIRQSFGIISDKINIYNNGDKQTSFNRVFLIPEVSLLFVPNIATMYKVGYSYQLSYFRNIFNVEYKNSKYASLNKNKFFVGYYKSTIDDKFFAVRGNVFKGNLSYNFDVNIENQDLQGVEISRKHKNYFDFVFEWDNYISLSSKWTIESKVITELIELDSLDNFILKDRTLGGLNADNSKQISFWGIPDNYVISGSKFLLRTGLRYKISDKIYMKSSVNSVVIDSGEFYFGGGLSFVYKSPIGPISASVASSFEHMIPIFNISMGYFR